MARRRNVKKLTLRPPLPRRAVVWFPAFENTEALPRIQRFREQHDPRAADIAPHLTLVFPFPTPLTVAQIASHIKHHTIGWPVLPVTFRGIMGAQGEFVFLTCDLRRDAVIEMHDRLYRGVLANFLRPDIAYEPHITLARVESDFERTLAEAELRFRETWRATLRELAIVTWSDDGTIIVDKTVPLNLA
jgi:2'-5' RNA ligase